jgi:hypothetical protein
MLGTQRVEGSLLGANTKKEKPGGEQIEEVKRVMLIEIRHDDAL